MPGDHQVVAVARVARVDDQVAEPRSQRDHLGRDDHQPGHAEADPHAHDDLGQDGRDHDLAKERGARDPEVLGRPQIAPLDRVHAGGRLHDHRKDRRDEDQIDGRGVPHAEPEDRDRDPGDRRDGPQHLEERVEGRERAVHPAHPEAERDADRDGEQESGAHPHQRGADVLPERPVLDQLEGAGHDLPGRREDGASASRPPSPTRARSGARSRPGRAALCSEPVHVARAPVTRQRSRAQGVAGNGSTRMVICPLAWAVQAN